LKWTDRIAKFLFRKKIPVKTNDPVFIIEKLFRTTDGVYISHAERERLDIHDTSFTYGEISPEGLAETLAIVQPKAGEVIYDLGSGTGKAVFCAALLYDWKKCIGIEFLPGLCQVSQELLKNFLKMEEIQQHFPDKNFPIEFIHDDFLNVDFSDADIIHLNATTLNPVLWGDLTKKLNALKPGTRLIVCTKKLDESHFEKIHEALHPMSWGDCTVFIYQKK
jgi:SAM-dependent methyltransferase